MILHKFLRDLRLKQIFRWTDKQTLKCRMATILPMGAMGKQKSFQRGEKKENRNICLKVMVEHTLIYVYIYIHISLKSVIYSMTKHTK